MRSPGIESLIKVRTLDAVDVVAMVCLFHSKVLTEIYCFPYEFLAGRLPSRLTVGRLLPKSDLCTQGNWPVSSLVGET